LFLLSYFYFGFGELGLLLQVVDFLDSRHQNAFDILRVGSFACKFCFVLGGHVFELLQVGKLQFLNGLLEISEGTLAAFTLYLKLLFLRLNLLQLLLRLLNLEIQSVVVSLRFFVRTSHLHNLGLKNINFNCLLVYLLGS
jgi:hypothetical protein